MAVNNQLKPYQYIAREVPETIFRRGSWDKLIYNYKIGFAISMCTVWFDSCNEVMEVWAFDEEGKRKDGFYIIPKTPEELIKKLKNACGEETINYTLNGNFKLYN